MRYRKPGTEGMRLRDDTADSVIAAFEDALAAESDGAGLLRAWIARYPALAPDLSMAASGFNDMRAGAEEAGLDGDGAARHDAMAAALIGEAQMPQPAAPAVAVDRTDLPSGLAGAARRAGVEYPHQLSARLRVPESLIRHLHRGDIDPRTIPSIFGRDLAELLNLTFADAVRLLRGPSPAAALVQEIRPPYGGTQSFESVLAAEATSDDRAYWSDRSRFFAVLDE